jgi:hypothetical protein
MDLLRLLRRVVWKTYAPLGEATLISHFWSSAPVLLPPRRVHTGINDTLRTTNCIPNIYSTLRHDVARAQDDLQSYGSSQTSLFVRGGKKSYSPR